MHREKYVALSQPESGWRTAIIWLVVRILSILWTLYLGLNDVVWEWQQFGDQRSTLPDYKTQLRDITMQAMNLSITRMQDYSNWCLRNSNNPGRYIEYRAYQHLANGLMLVDIAIQEEPPGLTRYARNDVLMELLEYASFAALHNPPNKHDTLES